MSGCSELQKLKTSLKAEILLSGSEPELTIRGSLSRDPAAAGRGRANECSVSIRLVQPIPKCHLSDVLCMIRTRKSRNKKDISFVMVCSSLSTAFRGRTPSNLTHQTEGKHSSDYHRRLHGGKSSCLVLEKKQNLKWKFVPQCYGPLCQV